MDVNIKASLHEPAVHAWAMPRARPVGSWEGMMPTEVASSIHVQTAPRQQRIGLCMQASAQGS